MPNLGIIQALLQTLNEIFQNKKVPYFKVIKILCFSIISIGSIIGRSQLLDCFFFKYKHLKIPDAAGFIYVDVVLS